MSVHRPCGCAKCAAPLPNPEPLTIEQHATRNLRYVARRARWRMDHPTVTREDIARHEH